MALDTKHTRGIAYMLGASFFFALTGACARYMRSDFSPIELVFFRNLIGVVFILLLIWRKPIKQIGGKTMILVFRGVIGTMALYFFFYGISNIGLAVAITYQQSYPIFLALMAGIIYHEKLNTKEWGAIMLGFVGICCIFVPSIALDSISLKSHLVGLGNAIMTGMAYLSIRKLSKYYDHRSIVLSFMLSGIIMPLISMGLGRYYSAEGLEFLISEYIAPRLEHIFPLLLLGVSAVFGQVFLTKAFSYGKTGIIAAVGYSNIIFSMFFGVLLGDSIPSGLTILGIIMIVSCGVMVSSTKSKTNETTET